MRNSLLLMAVVVLAATVVLTAVVELAVDCQDSARWRHARPKTFAAKVAVALVAGLVPGGSLLPNMRMHLLVQVMTVVGELTLATHLAHR